MISKVSLSCLIFASFLVFNVAGCGRKVAERVPVVPVSGKILVDGRPAKKARLFFHAQDRPKTRLGLPFAIADDDGSFKAGTYLADDGLPRGEYIVTVIWPTTTIEFGEEVSGPDQLSGKYESAYHPAAKVTVTDAPVVMPTIDLKMR